jgi:hypothetical protein
MTYLEREDSVVTIQAASSPRHAASVTRPGFDLSWLRLRLRLRRDAHGNEPARLLWSQAMAVSLNLTKMDGMPVHRWLGLRGAHLVTSGDLDGIVVNVTVPSEQLKQVAAALRRLLNDPLDPSAVSQATERVTSSWRWTSEDAEGLADVATSMILHTPWQRWPTAMQELELAASHDPSPLSELFSGAGLPLDMPLAEASSLLTCVHIGSKAAVDIAAGLASSGYAEQRSHAISNPHDSDSGKMRFEIPVTSEGTTLIRLGWRIPRRDEHDYAPLAVVGRVIGGHYHARLMREFRQARGWSYSPWAMARSSSEQGLW